MKIHKIINLIAFENTYILENNQGLLVVDPGSDWKKIERKLEELAKPVIAVLLTHTHYDHIMSLEKVREHYAAHLSMWLRVKAAGSTHRQITYLVWRAMLIWMILSVDQQKSFSPTKQTMILEAFTSMCLQHLATPSEVSL